jgi:hypothetical protein
MYQRLAWASVLVNDGAIIGLGDNRNRWTYHSDPARKIKTIAIDSDTKPMLVTLNMADAVVSITSSNDHWERQIDSDLPYYYAAEKFLDMIRCLFNCRDLEQLFADLINNEPTSFGTERGSSHIVIAGAMNRFREETTPEYRAREMARPSMFSLYPRDFSSMYPQMMSPNSRFLTMFRANMIARRSQTEADQVDIRLVSHEAPTIRSLAHTITPPNQIAEVGAAPTVDRCCQLNNSIAYNQCCCRCEMCSLHPSREDRIRAEKERKATANAKHSDQRGRRNRR